MHERSPCRVGEERLRDRRSPVLVGFSALCLSGLTLGVISAFELMIPRCLAEQLLKFRRCIVRWRSVDADDTVITVESILRSKLQASDSVGVNCDEMKSVGGNWERKLLHGLAVTAVEQRRLASLLREEIRRADGQHLRGCWPRGGRHRFKSPFRDRSDGIHRNSFRTLQLLSSNDAAGGHEPAGS